jgi:hypothetical protein|tara:strand:- start:344 stop:499 length:156 start_codon:yes stop_codon:yes gene_type:complete
MTNIKKNSIEPRVSADYMLPVITKAMAVVVQVAVILQVVAFNMLRFLLSNG